MLGGGGLFAAFELAHQLALQGFHFGDLAPCFDQLVSRARLLGGGQRCFGDALLLGVAAAIQIGLRARLGIVRAGGTFGIDQDDFECLLTGLRQFVRYLKMDGQQECVCQQGKA